MRAATILACALVPALAVMGGAQEAPRPISIGEVRTMRSAILAEDRAIWISLPENYARSATSYPVLYALDGSSHFLHATSATQFLADARNRIPEMIVVAVPNTNRNRDLTPGPGATNFQRFFANELIPWVEANYRAAPERVIVGHSRGGMFVVHTLLHHPELFRGYVAISTPLYRYDSLAQQAQAGLGRAAAAGVSLHLSIGEQDNVDMRRGMEQFAEYLRTSAPTSLRWSYTLLRDEDHNSSPHQGLYEALETRYADWRLPLFEDLAALDQLGGLRGVESHYEGFSSRAGYPTAVPENRILSVGQLYVGAERYDETLDLANRYALRYPPLAEHLVDLVGQAQLRRGQTDEAVRTLSANAERWPASPNAHRSLGDAYCRAGLSAPAAASHLQAVRAAEASAHPRLARFQAAAQRGCATQSSLPPGP